MGEPTGPGAYGALYDALSEALAQGGTVLDEADTDYVIRAVLPVVAGHGTREYDRGLQAGDFFARRAVARRLGLGEVKPDGNGT